MKLFPPIGCVAFDENVFHADLDGIHAQTLGDFVHLLFASPSALRNTIAAIRAGDRFVGVHRKAVDFDMGDAIWAGRGQTAADTHRRALFRVSAGAPVDGHLARHEGAVFLYPALAINHRLVAGQSRDESLFAVKLHAHGTAVGVKSKSHRDGFDFEAALRPEAPALKRVDKTNFLFGHVQRFGNLMERAERRVIGDPNRQPSAFLVELGVRRMGFHRGVLNDRNEISFTYDKIRLLESNLNISGAQFEMFSDVRQVGAYDEIHFAILSEIFMKRHAAGFAGFLRLGINGQIFVLDFNQFHGGLSDVLVLRCYSGHRLTNVANLTLG